MKDSYSSLLPPGVYWAHIRPSGDISGMLEWIRRHGPESFLCPWVQVLLRFSVDCLSGLPDFPFTSAFLLLSPYTVSSEKRTPAEGLSSGPWGRGKFL